MIDRQLAKCLDPVAARVRQFWLGIALGVVWFSAAVAGGMLLWKPSESWQPRTLAWGLLLGAVAVAAISAFAVWHFAKNYPRLARRIETEYPDLGASLITALELKPGKGGSYTYLQQEVLRKAYLHSYQKRWDNVMPQSRLLTARLMNFLGLLAFAAVIIGLFAAKSSLATVPDGLAFDDVKVIKNPKYSITVEPGTTEVERGSSLLVMARFTGPLPPDATLVYQTKSGEDRQLAMSKSLRDPVFGGRILAVAEPLTYRVEFAEQKSDEFQVTVFEYPTLKQADARLEYPSYTNLEEKLIQDVRRISVVEGTKVTLLCRLNKPVAEARLTEQKDEKQPELKLAADPAEPLVYQVTFPVDRSRRLKLHLKDADGRTNQQPPEFVINALPNRPPDLKLAFPSRDVQVSPVEELDVKATAWDDYGLARTGLSFSTAGQPIQDVVLGQNQPAKERVSLEHLLSFEAMNAQPDQLVSYFFWAEDIGPDGGVRRTSSDMYFAEVRHFEEIFRQGQQPTEEQMRNNNNSNNKASKAARTPRKPNGSRNCKSRSSMAPGKSSAARPAISQRTNSKKTCSFCWNRSFPPWSRRPRLRKNCRMKSRSRTSIKSGSTCRKQSSPCKKRSKGRTLPRSSRRSRPSSRLISPCSNCGPGNTKSSAPTSANNNRARAKARAPAKREQPCPKAASTTPASRR